MFDMICKILIFFKFSSLFKEYHNQRNQYSTSVITALIKIMFDSRDFLMLTPNRTFEYLSCGMYLLLFHLIKKISKL